jgi:hypothetical protein
MSKHSSSSLGNYWWSRVADTIGDWNPQLLRELKSRVSWRSVSLAMLLSIGLQVLIVINKFNKILPNINDRYQSYCKAFTGQKCAVDAMGNPVISWPTWWGDVSVDISQAMFVGLLVVGVYALASNFKQEKKRGTLNFLRLSPQKARSIIVGKLLGLPALVYLGVLCAVPLQMYAAHSAQIARANVLAWDLAMLGLGIFFYLGAVLATLWSGILPIVLTAITVPMSYTFVSLSLRWHGQYAENSVLQWYGIKFINHPLAFLLMAAMSALGIYWIYKAIEHRYHQPTGAVLSRLQSYVWSFTYHLFLLGFCTSYRYDPSTNKLADRLSFDFRLHTYVGNGSNDTVYGYLPSVYWLMFLGWFLLLIPALLPSKQSLTDWHRKRQEKQRWWKTRLWDDHSPVTLAVLVNLMIASLVWILPTIIASSQSLLTIVPLLLTSFLITANFMAIFATIAHLLLFSSSFYRRIWKFGLLGLNLLLAAICGTFYGYFDLAQWLWWMAPGFWGFLHWIFWPFSIATFAMLIWLQRCFADKLAEASHGESATWHQHSSLGI